MPSRAAISFSADGHLQRVRAAFQLARARRSARAAGRCRSAPRATVDDGVGSELGAHCDPRGADHGGGRQPRSTARSLARTPASRPWRSPGPTTMCPMRGSNVRGSRRRRLRPIAAQVAHRQSAAPRVARRAQVAAASTPNCSRKASGCHHLDLAARRRACRCPPTSPATSRSPVKARGRCDGRSGLSATRTTPATAAGGVGVRAGTPDSRSSRDSGAGR